jgi:hypothetical protein
MRLSPFTTLDDNLESGIDIRFGEVSYPGKLRIYFSVSSISLLPVAICLAVLVANVSDLTSQPAFDQSCSRRT